MKVIYDLVQKLCDNLFIFIFDIFWKNVNISELHDPICLNFLEIIGSYMPKIFKKKNQLWVTFWSVTPNFNCYQYM